MNPLCLPPRSGQSLLLHQSLVLWSLAQRPRNHPVRRVYHRRILLVMSHPLCLMNLTMQKTGVHCALVNTYPTYRVLLRLRPLRTCSTILDTPLLLCPRECHIHRLRIDDASLIWALERSCRLLTPLLRWKIHCLNLVDRFVEVPMRRRERKPHEIANE